LGKRRHGRTRKQKTELRVAGNRFRGLLDFVQESLEGAFHSTHWHPGVVSGESREFLDLYRARYGEDLVIDPAAPLTYDAVGLVIAAARRAGSVRPADIRSALAATRDYPGATGRITMNGNGDPMGKEAVVMEAEHGAWVFRKSHVP